MVKVNLTVNAGQDLDSGHHGSGFPLPPFRQALLERHLAAQEAAGLVRKTPAKKKAEPEPLDPEGAHLHTFCTYGIRFQCVMQGQTRCCGMLRAANIALRAQCSILPS